MFVLAREKKLQSAICIFGDFLGGRHMIVIGKNYIHVVSAGD